MIAIGDLILPGLLGIMITHSRETYQPTSIMRWDRGIFNGSHKEVHLLGASSSSSRPCWATKCHCCWCWASSPWFCWVLYFDTLATWWEGTWPWMPWGVRCGSFTKTDDPGVDENPVPSRAWEHQFPMDGQKLGHSQFLDRPIFWTPTKGPQVMNRSNTPGFRFRKISDDEGIIPEMESTSPVALSKWFKYFCDLRIAPAMVVSYEMYPTK